jgi:hypothetical protein
MLDLIERIGGWEGEVERLDDGGMRWSGGREGGGVVLGWEETGLERNGMARCQSGKRKESEV